LSQFLENGAELYGDVKQNQLATGHFFLRFKWEWTKGRRLYKSGSEIYSNL